MNDLIIGMGEVLWDMLPQGKKAGGAPANFACHVSRFGLKSCVISAVGDDVLGHELTADLDRKKVNHVIAEVPYPTGAVMVDVDAAGVPCYTIKEGVAWDNIPFTPELETLAKKTRAVCFGSLAQRNPVSRETISRFLDAVPDGEGQYKIFDINLRQKFYTKDVLRDSLNKCNILKLNDEELVTVSRLFGCPDTDFQMACRILIKEFRLDVLILTCGTNGSYVFTHGGISFQPTPKVEVADTVGAGDSFTAAFISCMIKGCSVTEAHKRAVAVSAYVCSRPGATPELPAKLTE